MRLPLQAIPIVASLVTLFAATSVRAEPQGRGGLRAGVCGVGVERAIWQRTAFCPGLTLDLVLGRERNRDVGIGPFIEVSTAGLWDFRAGGGVTALLPLHPDFPLALSLGVYAHELETAALGGSLFFGARSFNFHGTYNLALGLFASTMVDLGAEHATLVTLGADVDLFFVAVPFVLLADAVR